MKTIVARICYPDDPYTQAMPVLELMKHYQKTKGGGGDILVNMCVEDDDLVIELNLGFHCLFIPLKELRELIKK